MAELLGKYPSADSRRAWRRPAGDPVEVSTKNAAVSVQTVGQNEVLRRRKTKREEGKNPESAPPLVKRVEEVVQL